MHMMTSQILKSVDFTKTRKSSYLEKETLFFLQKNSIIAHQGLFFCNKWFCSVITSFDNKQMCHSDKEKQVSKGIHE